MVTIAERRGRSGVSVRGLITIVVVALFFAGVFYFLGRDGPNIVSHPAAKQWAFGLHMAGGTLVLALAPFQFIAPIRERFRRYHRIAGYMFLLGTALAAIGFVLIQPASTDLFFASQLVAITLWVLCAGIAWQAARRKRFLTHRHNMTRAFVLASYFVAGRLFDKFGMALMEWFTDSRDAQFAHSDWLAWVIPLILVEAYYGRLWDRLLRRREVRR